jgi:hypothetical protein
VYAGPTRINELCGAWDNATTAYREAQRIALAAHNGTKVHDIIAAKPSELALAAVRELLNETVPAGEHRQVRPTLAHAHLAPLTAPQRKALRDGARNTRNVVYVGQATRATLSALSRKGCGTLNYLPGMGLRRVIDSLTLNQRGLDYAAANDIAAAAA